jgi:hypothetical protein
MSAGYPSRCSAVLCLLSFGLALQASSAELRLPREGWSSWQVPAVDAAPDWCCWRNWNARDASRRTCRLDDSHDGYSSRDEANTDAVRVYARLADGKVDRLRVLSATCPVETAMPIRDLGAVAADDSARWLIDLAAQSIKDSDTGQRVGRDALAALAINRGDLAREALARFARNDAADETRKEAVFWLALLRGQEGADIAASIMFSDRHADLREHAAFAVSQSKSPHAAADLIRLGNTDNDSAVRAQAWFWLAQTGDAGAESAIAAALRKDTDDDVREQAIFALSQLPDERAARALIATVEDRSLSREQRKRAVFWLSQSKSDAAHRYLEKVLTVNAAN